MAAESTSTLSTFTASDGDNLAVQDWPLPEGAALRGFVLIVHGLGEHAGRYEHVARRLNGWGFAVRGYDQFGHGESGGARGALPTANRLLDDLSEMVESTRSRTPDGKPLILLGHSMGGLVAARYAAEHPKQVDALVLSSPALATHMSPFQKFLSRLIPQLAPNLRLGNGLNTRYLSHDPHVERAYKADVLVHDRISARLVQFIAEGGPKVIAQASQWKVPTLLMYAGQDRLVNPQGSREFEQAAPNGVVTACAFPDLYHEIFNEREAEPVYECLRAWLEERF
ncbi:alpha/beta hydrolase [Ramlibacter humi]|uniref:Alpha/beta hydrolase n=1 Tax=Ramlibacter humi TaxID=2530451 RepID=A0A4Z0BVC5_9BURK|nr:alpha/beta hydrolase [Ramlibacter humi]TFZ01939.1 alpha/beta hydrolase [Ramlibacter humi]